MALIGSSAIYTTIDDFGKWAIALQGNDSIDSIVDLMKSDGHTNDGSPVGYGFGLSIGTYKGVEQIEHTGATPSGFRSAFTWFPTEELSVIILSNWGNLDLIGDFGRDIVHLFLDHKKEGEEESTQSETIQSVSEAVTEKEIDQVVGDYLFNNEMSVKIRRSAHELTITPEGQSPLALIPLGQDRFNFPAFHSVLEFNRSDDGRYDSATIYAGSDPNPHGTLVRLKESEKEMLEIDEYLGHFYSEELGVLLELKHKDGQLLLCNEKHGEMILSMRSSLRFRPEGHIASGIEFTKSDSGTIESLFLSRGSRLRNVAFVKVAIP